MSTYRQAKVYVGTPPSGGYFDDPIVDSLGNSWISAGFGFGAAPGAGPPHALFGFTSWYMPSTVDTLGGACTFRGVSFDAPILPGALCVAVALRFNSIETHLVLIEFGKRAATTAFDYGSGYAVDAGSSPVDTAGQLVATATAATTGVSGNGQVWLAVTSTSRSVTALSHPAEFTLLLDVGTHRVYTRVDTTPLTVDPLGAWSWDLAARWGGHLLRLDDVTFSTGVSGPALSTAVLCKDDGTPHSPQGPALPPNHGAIAFACAGGGSVPTASDVTDAEFWG